MAATSVPNIFLNGNTVMVFVNVSLIFSVQGPSLKKGKCILLITDFCLDKSAKKNPQTITLPPYH